MKTHASGSAPPPPLPCGSETEIEGVSPPPTLYISNDEPFHNQLPGCEIFKSSVWSPPFTPWLRITLQEVVFIVNL